MQAARSDCTTHILHGLAALNGTSVAVTGSPLDVGGGGDRKKGHGEGGEDSEASKHVDTVEDGKEAEAVDELD